jgi:large repetitive protein
VDYNQFPPVAVNDESLGNPPGAVTLNVTGNDSGPEQRFGPQHGPIRGHGQPGRSAGGWRARAPGPWTAAGNVTFTPQAGFTDDPTPVSYTVFDLTDLESNEATITIDYVPVATDDTSAGNTTGTPVTVDVLGNDTTGDAVDPTTVQIVGTANPGDPLVVTGEGTWSVDPGDGSITFTPEAGYTGDPAPIEYTVDDAEGNTSDPATVTVEYNQFPPVAVNDESLGNPPGAVTLNVTDNDSDPNNDLDPSTVQFVGTANPGDPLVVTGEGTWTVDSGWAT